MKRTLALAAVALLAAPPAPAAAMEGPRFGLTADVVYDDNATRGLYAPDRKSDSIVSVEGSMSGSWLLGPTSGALFRASARYSHFTDIEDISNLAVLGRAAYRIQPGGGFSSPWYEIAGQGVWLKFADSELRDGTILTIEATIGSNVTDRLRLSGVIGYDKRNGGGTAGLYDLSQIRIGATADLRTRLRDTLYGRLTWLDGDQVFNSVTVSGLSPVWEPDPAFISVFGRPTDSYRLEAKTLLYELGYNIPLGTGRHSLDFSVSGFDAKSNQGSLKYDGMLYRASYVYRFQ
jgi:hypothetical protein